MRTSWGGFAPSRLEYATGSDPLLLSTNPYAPAAVTWDETSSVTQEPAVGTCDCPSTGPVVAGLLFHVSAVSPQDAEVVARSVPVVVPVSVTNRRRVALSGGSASTGTVNRRCG